MFFFASALLCLIYMFVLLCFDFAFICFPSLFVFLCCFVFILCLFCFYIVFVLLCFVLSLFCSAFAFFSFLFSFFLKIQFISTCTAEESLCLLGLLWAIGAGVWMNTFPAFINILLLSIMLNPYFWHDETPDDTICVENNESKETRLDNNYFENEGNRTEPSFLISRF